MIVSTELQAVNELAKHSLNERIRNGELLAIKVRSWTTLPVDSEFCSIPFQSSLESLINVRTLRRDVENMRLLNNV
jgi:hypothetical protein